MEIQAEAIFMAKNGVEGVYDRDPKQHADAKLIPVLTFDEMLNKKLEVMDLTAVSLLKNSDIVIRVFDMNHEGNMEAVLDNPAIGTTLKKGV